MKPIAASAIAIVLILILGLFISAFVVMLISGGLAHVYNTDKLLISYGESFVVSLALIVIGAFFGGGRK